MEEGEGSFISTQDFGFFCGNESCPEFQILKICFLEKAVDRELVTPTEPSRNAWLVKTQED